MPRTRQKLIRKTTKRRKKTRQKQLGGGPDNEQLTPLEFIRAKLMNTDNRVPISKTVKYKKLLATTNSEFPATNEEKSRVSESIKANKRTLTVPRIFEILDSSRFFKEEYLPVLDTMAKVDKKTGARIPTFKTENRAHPEFAEYQIKKQDQYFTQDEQLAMKKETFYEYSVDELWAWWDDKFKHFMELRESGKTMHDFPLNYSGPEHGPSILKIMKITFVNALSKIINSYIKYGTTTQSKFSELQKLQKFLKLLDALFDPKNNKQTYRDLLLVLEEYIKFWQLRLLAYKKNKKYTDENLLNSVRKLFNDLITNNYLIIPFSNPLAFYKTIKAYTIPVVFFNITNTLGHYSFLRPDDNIIHDLYAHNNWPRRNNLLESDNIAKFEKSKIFFEEYEKLQTKSVDKDRLDYLDYLNYFVFSKIHEDDIYFYEMCARLLSPEKCAEINDENIWNMFPLYRLMFIVKMLSLNANTDGLKKIFVNKSSLPQDADEIHRLNYVLTDDDGTTKVLGTQEHPQYIPLDILSEIISMLDTLFIRLHLYDNEDLIESIPVQ